MSQIILHQPGNYEYVLSQAGEELEVLGAFALHGQDNFHLHITLIHEAPHTKGNIIIKATVDDQAKAYISGNIIVNKTATDTDSFLSEKVLLLSRESTAEVIPNLEILNHDVHCSHAATISHIDEEQLFYLQSRGIDVPIAKTMIAEGFLHTVIDKMEKKL